MEGDYGARRREENASEAEETSEKQHRERGNEDRIAKHENEREKGVSENKGDTRRRVWGRGEGVKEGRRTEGERHRGKGRGGREGGRGGNGGNGGDWEGGG